jgi:GrpB-like predicted nucleotidyltransferase (UPF0157 family)
MPISVVPHNPEWTQWFSNLSKPIWEKIGDYVIDIIHVGSTSVVGMSAKPVIDIDVVVKDWIFFHEIVRRLGELGYEHQGDLGISGREAFKLTHESTHPHNLYVCHIESIAYKNHILLKKHLSENPEDFKRYKELKISLGLRATNVDEYTRRKTELILEFLAAEGVPEKEIEIIRVDNLL